MTKPAFSAILILAALNTDGPMGATEMIKRGSVKMSASRLSYHKIRLVAEGLVDDKAHTLSITPKGKEFLKKFHDKVYEHGHIIDFVWHEVNETGKVDYKAMTRKYRRMYARLLPISEATIRATVQQLKKSGRLEMIH